ncbi:MAG TPA: helicase-associated domain-containing protein [Microlunatus sp.]
MTAPRTLTEAIRLLDRDQLSALLRLRPDLRYPLPRHIAELVSQATTSTSIARAIDGLDGWQAAVAEALAVLPDGTRTEQVAGLLGQPEPAITPAVEALRRRALLWGADDDLHLVRAVRDHFGNYPAGLAPASPHPLTDAQIDQALDACGDQVRPVLDRLLWGPPTGTVRNADRAITPQAARTPVERLLAYRLLRPLDRDTVILSREVALRLRAEHSSWLLSTDPVSPRPPELTGGTRSRTVIRSAAAGAANELVHDVELIIAELDLNPRRLLRDGGLSARDVQAMARDFDGRLPYTGFLLEVSAAAGLVGSPDKITVVPSVEYDRWIGQPGPQRWMRLARAWRGAERYFSSAAETHPLRTDAYAARAVDNRKLILGMAAAAPIGTILAPEQLMTAAGWYRPAAARHGHRLDEVINWTWQEAEWLGLVALGGVSELLSVLAEDRDLPSELARLFPEPLDHVIIQSDLTAVAQGPLEAAVSSTLRLLADQESRGGGAVYRFSQRSVRRGFDAGWAAAEIGDWLQHHSDTGVPQPLRYLIDDVARQYGAIRVGAATSYLRVEDPAQQAAILAHPQAARLQLRSIAPGVLVSPADPDEVVTVLQDVGLKPAAEDAEGRLLTTGPRRRAAARTEGGPAARSATPDEAADAILAAEERLPAGQRFAMPLEDGIAALTDAVRTRRRIRVSYVGPDGTPATRELRPVELTGGSLQGIDAASSEIVSLPIARISGVLPGPDSA